MPIDDTEYMTVRSSGEARWDDIGRTMRWSAYKNWVDFKIREHHPQTDDSVCYEGEDENISGFLVDEFEQAAPLIDGGIKWDGCNDLLFYGFPSRHGEAHICEPVDFARTFVALCRTYEIADREMDTSIMREYDKITNAARMIDALMPIVGFAE